MREQYQARTLTALLALEHVEAMGHRATLQDVAMLVEVLRPASLFTAHHTRIPPLPAQMSPDAGEASSPASSLRFQVTQKCVDPFSPK